MIRIVADAFDERAERVVDVRAIRVHLRHGRAGDEASLRAAVPFSRLHVVGIEQERVLRIRRDVRPVERHEYERLEEPAGVREMPLRRADVGHGAHDVVLDFERRAERLGLRAHSGQAVEKWRRGEFAPLGQISGLRIDQGDTAVIHQEQTKEIKKFLESAHPKYAADRERFSRTLDLHLQSRMTPILDVKAILLNVLLERVSTRGRQLCAQAAECDVRRQGGRQLPARTDAQGFREAWILGGYADHRLADRGRSRVGRRYLAGAAEMAAAGCIC